jgi:hypothetical protein
VLVPGNSSAQGVLPGWNPISWFDWSDFRVDVNGRIMLPAMTLGKFEGATLNSTTQRISGSEGTIDFKSDLGMDEDPSTVYSVQFTAYIDRLGLRICYDAGLLFRGRQDLEWTNQVPNAPRRVVVSALDAESARVGIDLDIIRYPFFRLGIDFDVNTSRVRFARKYWNKFDETLAIYSNPVTRQQPAPPPAPPVFPAIPWTANYWDTTILQGALTPKFVESAHSLQPITIGLHATAIPVRIRDIPVILQARFRFPVPFIGQIPALNREYEARMFDMEFSGGLRPSVWETSLFGHSTFSIGVMAGYRWQYLEGQMVGLVHEYNNDDLNRPFLERWDKFDFKVKAAWHGAFMQLKAVF